MFDLVLDQRGGGEAKGEIVIGAHRESFLIDLSYWSPEDYRASWLRSAAHVLEHGYGRFLVSVTAPGQSTYISWVCRVRGDEPVFHKSFLLANYTEAMRQPEEAEATAEDYSDRHKDEPNLNVYRCTLRDIADFEIRLRGASAH